MGLLTFSFIFLYQNDNSFSSFLNLTTYKKLETKKTVINLVQFINLLFRRK